MLKWFGVKGSFYKKLFFSYICMLLVVVVLSPLTQVNTKKYITEKELQYAATNLYYIKDLVDAQINAIEKMSYTVLADEAVREAQDDFYSSRRIINKLKSMIGSINLLDNCFVVNVSHQTVTSAEGSEEKNYFQRFRSADGETIDINALYEKNDAFDCIPCVNNKNENVLLFLAKSAMEKSSNMIIAAVQESELKRFYSNQYNENLGEYMIVGMDGLVYSSSDATKISSNLPEEQMTILGGTEPAGAGVEQQMPFSKSNYFNWYYVMNINEKGINATANKIQFMWLVFISVCIVLETILIFAMSKWVYVPLGKLMEKFDIHTTNEFGEIGKILDQLKTDNIHYMRIYDSLHQVGRGINMDRRFLTAQGQLLAIVIRGQKLDLYARELLELMLKIEQCSVDFIQMDAHEIIGAVKYSGRLEALGEEMNLAAHRFLELYSLRVLIGMGKFVPSMDELKYSLNTAHYAIDYGIFHGNDFVMLPHGQETMHYSVCIEKEKIERELVFAVERHDTAGIETVITEIFEANKEIPNIYKYSLSIILINIYFTVGNKTDSWVLDYKMLTDELKYEYDTKLLRNFFIHLFLGFVLEKNEQHKDTALKNKILQCIEENALDQDFTLEVLAEKMDYSPAYMTKLLKKYFNENFTQYLIGYRIEKAKELLRQTDKSIECVSRETGFDTYNNFARIFRKKTGVSPSVYKKNV